MYLQAGVPSLSRSSKADCQPVVDGRSVDGVRAMVYGEKSSPWKMTDEERVGEKLSREHSYHSPGPESSR